MFSVEKDWESREIGRQNTKDLMQYSQVPTWKFEIESYDLVNIYTYKLSHKRKKIKKIEK